MKDNLLNQLNKELQGCTACPLHEKRTQAVLGRGNIDASLLIIGEAPGVEEDIHGLPFVGRSGKLLDSVLKSLHASNEAYITNLCRCRPPNNRAPTEEEIDQCQPFLKRTIDIIKPSVLLTLGRWASESLVKFLSFSELRKQSSCFPEEYEYNSSIIPVFCTIHPAYVLRNPSAFDEFYTNVKAAILHARAIRA